MHKLKHGLQWRCVPALVGTWMHPVLSARDVSPWVSASRPWRATAVYATHPGLPPGPWHEHQCGPSAADAPASVQMPACSATVALSAAQLYFVDAPAGLSVSAVKCDPLSNCFDRSPQALGLSNPSRVGNWTSLGSFLFKKSKGSKSNFRNSLSKIGPKLVQNRDPKSGTSSLY